MNAHNILPTPPVSTKHFGYDPKERSLSVEASSLGHGFQMTQVYADAADRGFTLVSHKTGKAMPMVQNREERVEGETHWWDFIPVYAVDRRIINRVRIFND